jgi:ATP-dependent helicase/nuclease subunit A
LLETTRLLYVGATRAISQLLLTASLQWDEKKESFRAPSGRSLLGPIWPTFAEQMTAHEPAVTALPLAASGPMHTLYRLQRSTAPSAPEPTADSLEPNIPIRAENQSERAIGTVVHLALEHLSALDTLPQEATEGNLQRWQLALQRLGLCGERLQTALAAVQGSVIMCLADEQGRWVLSSAHPQARSEWALTRVNDDGRIEDLIIDRTFVDETTATRWVVDYKNSQPAPGEDLTQFVARESLGYHEQLLRYRNALAELHTEPLCCALYFTALGHMHHLVELDLAGRGT